MRRVHANDAFAIKFSAIEEVRRSERRGDLEMLLLQKETSWIYRLRTDDPEGLNETISYTSFIWEFFFRFFRVYLFVLFWQFGYSMCTTLALFGRSPCGSSILWGHLNIILCICYTNGYCGCTLTLIQINVYRKYHFSFFNCRFPANIPNTIIPSVMVYLHSNFLLEQYCQVDIMYLRMHFFYWLGHRLFIFCWHYLQHLLDSNMEIVGRPFG